MCRQFLCMLGIAFTVVGISETPLRVQTASANTSPPGAMSAAEAYQNIQVLKEIPADQLVPAMQFITYSLGVECSYCHVEGALEKDDKKPKQTARKMMQMMAAINRDNFDSKQAVTCNSCHRGAPHPVATPIIAEGGPRPAFESVLGEDTSLTDAPPAEQIIAKYVEAIGGAAALQRISTRQEKGTINISGRNLPIEILSRIGGKQLTVIHLPNGDSITAYDGASGWTSAPNRPVREIPSVEVASAKPEVDLQLPLHIKQLFNEVTTAGTQKIGGRESYVVAGINSGEIAAKFYFDKESGYLLRILRYTKSPLGRNSTQIDYADFRTLNGLKVPFRKTIARPNSRLTVQIEDAEFNVPVDVKKFARPAVAPTPTRPSP
ncbi:MAG: c-type cytochrome [Acidobacteria bacterium]|nr:MAG: c-type cytochrome [Acidobacteriota bacterium]